MKVILIQISTLIIFFHGTSGDSTSLSCDEVNQLTLCPSVGSSNSSNYGRVTNASENAQFCSLATSNNSNANNVILKSLGFNNFSDQEAAAALTTLYIGNVPVNYRNSCPIHNVTSKTIASFIRFRIYNRFSSTVHIVEGTKMNMSCGSDYILPDEPVIIITPGWLTYCANDTEFWCDYCGLKLSKQYNASVITVDYGTHNISCCDWFPLLFCSNTYSIMTQFFAQLYPRCFDVTKITLIGHSLGSQMVGAVARAINDNNPGKKVQNCMCADPVGTGFRSSCTSGIDTDISSEFCQNMTVIHTNPGMIGTGDVENTKLDSNAIHISLRDTENCYSWTFCDSEAPASNNRLSYDPICAHADVAPSFVASMCNRSIFNTDTIDISYDKLITGRIPAGSYTIRPSPNNQLINEFDPPSLDD